MHETSDNTPLERKAFLWQRYVGAFVLFALVAWVALVNKSGQPEKTYPLITHFNMSQDLTANLPDSFTRSGSQFQLSEWKGSIVILAFWAEWCEPCLDDLPQLLALYQNQSDLKVVTLNIDSTDDQLEKAEKWVRPFSENHYRHFFLNQLDNQGEWQAFMNSHGIAAIPFHMIFDRTGKLRWQGMGTINWSIPPIQESLNLLLQEGIQGQ